MTEKQRTDELASDTIQPPLSCTINFVEIEDGPTYDKKYVAINDPIETPLNVLQGIAENCVETLIREEDKHAARERIKSEKEKGDKSESASVNWKKLTAGQLSKSSKVNLGDDVFQHVKNL